MPKYATVFFDSSSELARLYFSYDMGKHAGDMDKIRAMQNYPAATERLNMFVRRMKDFRRAGINVGFTAHEDIEKIYARGGAMAGKGQQPAEPAAIKGWPDIPGKRAPDEFCRAVDNVFRVRYVSGMKWGPTSWIARRETISTGSDYWEVKDRFNGPAINSGILPASYDELEKLAKANPACNWEPPYIWMLYGAFGIGKTRSILSFPRPIKIFDLDFGSKSISKEVRLLREKGEVIDIVDTINPEESNDYGKFVAEVEASLL